MSDITVINDSEQSSLVTNGLAKNGELYLKAAGSTNAGAIVVYDSGSWRTFANEYSSGFQNNFTAALDGANDYLTIPASSDFDFGTGDFSFTFWMRITSRAAYGGLFTRASTYRLKFQNADHIIHLGMRFPDFPIITYNPGGINTSLLNSWHHIMIVRDGTTVKGYVDNTEYGSRTLTTETFSASGSTFIWGDNFNNAIGGQLDEISIFNRALTSTERTAIYNNGASFDIGSAYTGADAPLAFYRCGDDDDDTNSVGGAVGDGDTIGTIKNVVNPGTHDMGQVNGATYSNANSPV
jgi:hypothetical protein